jgi:hypothetical protein
VIDNSSAVQLMVRKLSGGDAHWASHELVKDLMVTASLFDSFDSKPPAAGASTNDFGMTVANSRTF